MEKELLLKKSWLIRDQGTKIEDYYLFDEKKRLGKGTYGYVIKATQKGTSNVRVIKIIRKKKIKDKQKLISEIKILKHVDHPNIVRLYQIFETDEKLYLVMEYCKGGELIAKIVEGRLEESVAKQIFVDIVGARNICHRDLKPQNILLLDNDQNKPHIKIIDFGLSAVFTHEDRMKTLAGTIYYVSPEVLRGKYDQSCDVWSLGVILYALLSGRPPFDGESEVHIAQKIKKFDYSVDQQEFKNTSKQAKDLISECLRPSEKRITCRNMIQHPWFQDMKTSKHYLTISTVRKFKESSKLKILVLTYLATQLQPTETQYTSKIFKSYDDDHDGYLNMEELTKMFEQSGINIDCTLQDIMKYLKLVNTSKNGKITYNQFLTATIRPQLYNSPQKLQSAFGFFDRQKKGIVTFDDMKNLQQNVLMSKQEWAKITQDTLGQAKESLNFEDFCQCIAN